MYSTRILTRSSCSFGTKNLRKSRKALGFRFELRCANSHCRKQTRATFCLLVLYLSSIFANSRESHDIWESLGFSRIFATLKERVSCKYRDIMRLYLHITILYKILLVQKTQSFSEKCTKHLFLIYTVKFYFEQMAAIFRNLISGVSASHQTSSELEHQMQEVSLNVLYSVISVC